MIDMIKDFINNMLKIVLIYISIVLGILILGGIAIQVIKVINGY
tara:strand:+ start:249 stop:380 length:132 start_codon:yes stop_codon:yes gene_type:complete